MGNKAFFQKEKMAIVHDWLIKPAGAEKVLEEMVDIYNAPIYTLFFDKGNFKNSILNRVSIHTTFLQNIPNLERFYKNFLPFYTKAVESFDLSSYEVILSSSHAVAKGFKKAPNQLHICYCHTPFRYVWDMYEEYKRNMPAIKRLPFALTVKKLRRWDVKTAENVDFFIASSNFVADRIKRIYGKDSTVIYPPVDVKAFLLNTKKEDFYIFVGRLVNPYKKVDLVIEAFNRIKRKLIIIGDGDDKEKLKDLAGKNIEFLGWQNRDKINEYLGRAKALIFPSVDDFGLVSVEAQSCGTPVIAFNKGGATETVVDKKTGLFFNEQTPQSIIDAVEKFEQIENCFDPYEIRKNAERFDRSIFREKISSFINQKIYNFKQKRYI